MIDVRRVIQADQTQLEGINALLPQLSDGMKPITMEELEQILNPASERRIYAAYDGERLVGTMIMVVVRQFAGTKCWVEDVVVDKAYRGQSIGERMMDLAHSEVPPETKHINLTSNPQRESAHRLYERLGYVIRDTAIYRLVPS